MVAITELERREIEKVLRAQKRPDLRKLCLEEFLACKLEPDFTIAGCCDKIIVANPERLYVSTAPAHVVAMQERFAAVRDAANLLPVEERRAYMKAELKK
tara:strand:+ start:1966 stop:2265 length:300 start_codon:yes stop_codon:yes gene_type:complete